MKTIDEIGFLYIYKFYSVTENHVSRGLAYKYKYKNICWDAREILSYYRHVLPKTIIYWVGFNRFLIEIIFIVKFKIIFKISSSRYFLKCESSYQF